MLDIRLLREQTDRVKERLATRGVDADVVDRIVKLDTTWRAATTEEGKLRAEQKALGTEHREQAKKAKERIKELQKTIEETAEQRDALVRELPNVPFDDVPVGPDETANVVLEVFGKAPSFDFPVKDYMELGRTLDLIDMERASRVSGSRFGYWKNEAVLLEFALVQYALQTLIKEGFTPILPPVLIRPEVMVAMGKSKFIEDNEAYHLADDDLYLAGSSEHSIGPYHMGEVLEEKELPKRYVGFSSCFRRESGSYGKDTKGTLRVHQFDKLEMISFCHPERSEEEHRLFLKFQERLMDGLGLHFRSVAIATGDMTFPDARQFDIETWFPGEGKFRETHSTSNTTDYQSRGLKIRFNAKDGKLQFVHMLNGTAFSQRPILAILEQFQNKDGSVTVPKVLRTVVGRKEIRR